MANPKRKTSKSKRDLRRNNWYKEMKAAEVTTCNNCGATKLAHAVCPECGYYNGRKIVAGSLDSQ